MLDSEAQLEIANLVQQALARFGVPGVVEVQGDTIRLLGGDRVPETKLSPTAAKWLTLSRSEQERVSRGMARELANGYRGQVSGGSARGAASPRRRRPAWLVALGASAVSAAAIVGLYLGWESFGFGADQNAQPAAAPIDFALERANRERRVCEATRVRITQGARIGGTDVEGWVVEMTLVRDPNVPRTGSMDEFFAFDEGQDAPGRVRWEGAPTLKEADGGRTGVTVTTSWVGAGDDEKEVERVTFTGRYVNPFFDARSRIEFIRLANALAAQENATHGALYARCEHSDSHHMGAWFRGESLPGALSSLLYFGGAKRSPSVVAESFLAADGADLAPPVALEGLRVATQKLKASRVAELLGKHGGMVSSHGGHTALRFPLHDPNGASRAASRAAQLVAREVGAAAQP